MKTSKITTLFISLMFSAVAMAQEWTSASLSGDATDGYYINMPQTGMTELTLTAESPTTFKVYDEGGEDGRASINCSGYLSITVPTGKVIYLSGFVTTNSGKDFEYLKIHNGKDADEGSWDDYKYGWEDSNVESVEFVSRGNTVTLYFRTDEYDDEYSFSNVELTVKQETVTNLNLGRISGLPNSYDYNNGSPIAVEYTVENVTGLTLTKGVDYTATITDKSGKEVTSVTDEGEYTLTIDGDGEYTGTLTRTIIVGGIDLSKLTENYTASDGEVLAGTTTHTVYIADGATVTLGNATITGGIVCNGSVTIILAGENNVNTSQTATYEGAGILIGGRDTKLIIKGEGSLTVEGKGNGAGIGTLYDGIGGSIEIQGGTINAKGGQIGGAGIGSGVSGHVQDIIISGGTITAIGEGSGIGSGDVNVPSSCGDITISGGTVVATGGSGCPGIGASTSSWCGDISITGGTITSVGGNKAAGIGSGNAYYGNAANCGDITITEGITSLTATRGTGCENAIGAGNGSECGTITIGGVETGAISEETYTIYTYTVAYDANGGTGTMEATRIMAGAAKQLTECSLTREDYVFVGWNTEEEGTGEAYTDKAEVKDLSTTAGATVTLYAQWKKLMTSYDVAVAPIADQTYTGSAIEPEVRVTVGKGGSMKLDKDYTVTYSNNVKAGTATVTIKGVGYYTGERTVTFTIKRATPTFEDVESREIDYNQTLADVELPDGYSFVDENQTLEVGENTVALYYNPDPENYENASGSMTVIVKKAVVTGARGAGDAKSQSVRKYVENGKVIIEVKGVKYDLTGKVVK